MNIKHNARKHESLSFSELLVGQVYISTVRSPQPAVYLACCLPGNKRSSSPPDFLVNFSTGCQVVPSDAVEFKHLPDAVLDTGT